LAGSISNKGFRAPDVYLKAYGKLPDYYITKEEAYKLGWEPGKNLAHFAPGKMIGGEPYLNKKGYLQKKRVDFGTNVMLIMKAGKEMV